MAEKKGADAAKVATERGTKTTMPRYDYQPAPNGVGSSVQPKAGASKPIDGLRNFHIKHA